MAKKHMHIKVEDTLLDNFDATCQQHGLDRSEVIRNLMFEFVKRNKYKEEVISMRFLKELNDYIYEAKTIKNGIGEDVTPEAAMKVCRKAHREGRLSGEIGRRVRVASNDPYEQLDIIF
jgi:antitoxin component of RelBE/YafQ-DinJ toxin-antitoxin module